MRPVLPLPRPSRSRRAKELYWIGREISPGSEFSNYSTLPASSADHSVIISGVGLAKYYHPNLHDSFQCTFTPDSGQAQITLGSIVPSLTPYNSYGLSCPVPAMAAGRITISVIKFDGNALRFNGFAGGDTITAAQFWANLVSVTAAGTLVEGAGFNTSKRCKGFPSRSPSSQPAHSLMLLSSTALGLLACIPSS